MAGGVKEVVERAVARVGEIAARVGEHIPDAQMVDWKDPKALQQVADTAAVRKASDDAAKKRYGA